MPRSAWPDLLVDGPVLSVSRRPTRGKTGSAQGPRHGAHAAQTRDWIATARTLSRGPALPAALRRRDRRDQARRPRDGRRRRDGRVRPRRGADEAVQRQPGGGARRRADDQRHAEAARHRARSSSTASGSPTRPPSRWSRWCCRGASTSASCRRSTRQGGKAVGLSGKDANLMICEKDLRGRRRADRPRLRRPAGRGEPRGAARPSSARTSSRWWRRSAPGGDGETFNVNGDTAAGAIAAAMKADRLLLLTDVAGVKDAERRGADAADARRRCAS